MRFYKGLLFIISLLFSVVLSAQDLNQGLIGRWDLAAGSAIDISGNGNNGIIYNTTGTLDRFGTVNEALDFSGNGQISFGNVLDMGLGDFSMGAWFKINPANTGVYAIATKKTYGIGVDNKRIRVYFEGAGTLDVRMGVISDDSWHYVAVTFDRDGFLKIYLDGEAIGSRDISSSSNTNVQSTHPFFIGRYNSPSYSYRGSIDDVRIYNRVLSEEEVIQLSLFNDSNCTELITNNEENIGIGGLPNQNYGLTVEGNIYTDQVKVMDVDTWPDYVFFEGYDLLDLEDVASYIEEQGHLPGLPSAEEVLSDGISLTQMDKTNLKKLEELSLYLLDQHDRMERLRAPKTQKAPVLAYRTDKERPYNFVFEQSGIAEGKGQLKTMSTDSLSTGNIYCDGDNVGIGVAQASGYRLAVLGGILSEGVKVSSVSNWPDYVFSDDYALLSLEGLRAYIRANKHLPGLPSAKTIAREGYSLSEMDRLLMEKVEELTLYVIQQEEELQSLSGALGVILPLRGDEVVSDKTVYKSHNVDIETHLKAPTQKEERTFRDMASPRSIEASTEALCDVISCDGEGVGIGADPVEGYRLAVSGGILTHDIQVASVANWPDYVFEADYKLRDLLSLSAYIEREGHLPGVPKAEILGQEGYRLEVMDGLLLEKIEELTLYLIQQERQLTFLESRKQ
ncbi:Concanavalin A-like lectin/glucanases superfamily protein [Salegentibacter salinarum]|uniref:LamG domain-containing protein n=1 Tax=Salegentibacter salinarum TaxID=447422 RepID=UPI0009A68B66|nr:LamG domain-containing protein [Salegentibacter salinarum]SKB98717.1 Concanavalin A-like lectin/glucanases superfamily protein [Salegentibacter salinarum]